ncbi:LOW QUALITY PROTEIN: hypothetical protein PHMEG_00021213 [Phytophthora megakarya]|uniref:Uncharacterized protein n=1 Tax=Phytophthora megakarya TaxID=4795 RepID=A0A225VMG2_9STRA|nr:LOW QUALITY PROTEIN: hypothetical protein PHMEG_00021213 [Phytophthora megakarya]
MIEPLLEHLSGLPSTEFYSELSAWKGMIETGLSSVRSGDPANLASDDDDEDYDDEVETFRDPADEIATLELMQSMEGVEMYTMFLNEVSPDSSLSKATIPEPKPSIPEATIPVAQPKFESGQDDQFEEEPAQNDAAKNMKIKQERQVDIINIPKPPRQTNGLHSLKIMSSYVRYSMVKYPRDLTVNVHQVTKWARLMPDLKFVKEILNGGYCIVSGRLSSLETIDIPLSYLTISWVRLSKQEKNKAGTANAKNWIKDMKWLKQDWTKVKVSFVGLFDREIGTFGQMDPNLVLLRHHELASQIIPNIRTACLCTSFRLNTHRIYVYYSKWWGIVPSKVPE